MPFQLFPVPNAFKRRLQRAGPVKQKQSDVLDTEATGKRCTVFRADIRNKIADLFVIEGTQRFARVALKLCAKTARWVVDLHDGWQALTKLGQVLFRDRRPNSAHGHHTANSKNSGCNGAVS